MSRFRITLTGALSRQGEVAPHSSHALYCHALGLNTVTRSSRGSKFMTQKLSNDTAKYTEQQQERKPQIEGDRFVCISAHNHNGQRWLMRTQFYSIHVHVSRYTYTYTYTFTYTYTYTYTCIDTYIHTYIHTYMHTYTLLLLYSLAV